MENNVKQTIAKTLVELRRRHRFTQQELAQRLNYSDKAISRWEHAETLPDIETLCKVCDIYGVKFEYLLQVEQPTSGKNPYIVKKKSPNKLIISMLAVMIVWLLACVLFASADTFGGKSLWILFIWALPVSGVVLWVLNRMWGTKLLSAIICSFTAWTLILSIYLQFLAYNIWMLFIVGVPIQVLIVLVASLGVGSSREG